MPTPHALCSWAELVGAVLQHYMRLPEVQRTEGRKFVPVYYWVRRRAAGMCERVHAFLC